MLSGIGSAAHLREAGVDVRSDLHGVGRNLHDHLMNWVNYRSRRPMRDGAPYANLPHLSCRSGNDADPDLQLVLSPVVWGPRWSTIDAEGYSIVFALMNPASRGSIRLNTADPAGAPVIDPAYFADERDLDRVVIGLREARRIGASSALAPWRGTELSPGPTAEADADLRHYIRTTAGTYFHPVGTCRMGVDELAVVDPELRVHGVDGLRVADASVMPAVVSANTNATVLAIAERAAAILHGVPAA
jgi:choline dehydrogenase